MKITLPSPVLHSLFALNQAGYEAYVVGGCVRDSLMGKEPYDWDITTSALPHQTAAVFAGHRTYETGIQHGTITVFVKDMPLEITTYRLDGDYSDGRHPDEVTFTPSLTEDLRRRDFTVNAMAYHPDKGLIDPFHGQEDLVKRTLRCVGDPTKRFTEDALRILRCLRFSSTLDFQIEPETDRALRALAPSLNRIAVERIATELNKLLCGINAANVVEHNEDTLSVILPQSINYHNSAMRMAAVEKDVAVQYAALLWDCTHDEVAKTIRTLRLSNRIGNTISSLLANKDYPLNDSDSALLRLLNRLGPTLAKHLLSLRRVNDQTDYADAEARLEWHIRHCSCYQTAQLEVNGADLLAIGITPGPAVGIILQRLLEAVMDGECDNDRQDLLNYAKSLC